MPRHRPSFAQHRPWISTALAGLALSAAVGLLSIPAVTQTADPGVLLYTYMHDHGATMPASWAQVVDANHALICRNYANGYQGWPVGDRDDYGVTVPLAKAALAATGFCGVTR